MTKIFEKNDYDSLITLLKLNEIYFHEMPVYDEDNKPHPCIWFMEGHIEFDDNKKIVNIVDW